MSAGLLGERVVVVTGALDMARYNVVPGKVGPERSSHAR